MTAPADQRLTKVEGGTTTKFVYDGAKVALESDGDDETQVRYTHEGGSLYDDLLSQRRDGASYDYLLDGLGSTKQVVDSSQAVENSYSYEAFGQPTIGQSDVANPYLFVGGYGVQWESSPSLYFMQARYYGPGVGRFISEDPYGGAPQDPLSLHRYLYCGNGPVIRSDAAGLLWECFVGCAALVVLAGVDTVVLYPECVEKCNDIITIVSICHYVNDVFSKKDVCGQCQENAGEDPSHDTGWEYDRRNPHYDLPGGIRCYSIWVLGEDGKYEKRLFAYDPATRNRIECGKFYKRG